ncbi:MAG TPA: DUF2934 domain-containing protein, partial [Steroidobacteraceae bacterium]
MASKSGSTYRQDMSSRSGIAAAHIGPAGSGVAAVERKSPEIPEHLRAAAPPSAKTVHFDPSSSREALIATAAYYRAEGRGFVAGFQTEDWLAAEREIDGVGS